MAFPFMLAASASWYLPALFLPACRGRVRFRCSEASSNAVGQTIVRWAPPIMVLGLLFSRAIDLIGLDANHPEVALILGQGASMGPDCRSCSPVRARLKVPCSRCSCSPCSRPSCPACVPPLWPPRAIQSRMMTHAGWWGLLTLMVVFAPADYELMTSAPTPPRSRWRRGGARFHRSFHPPVDDGWRDHERHSAHGVEWRNPPVVPSRTDEDAAAGAVAWWLLMQTDVMAPDWWARPMTDARLAMGALIATYATLMATSHAFSTVAEGLHSAAARQANLLTWSLAIISVVLVSITSITANAVDVYGSGTDAALTGWRWAALALTAGVMGMALPMVGFDAAHHPEAWWFRMGMMLFLPIGVLMADGGWLLLPAMLLAGGVFPVVHLFVMAGPSRRTAGVLAACLLLAGWLLCATSSPERALFWAAAAAVSTTAYTAAWYRRERQRSPSESVV